MLDSFRTIANSLWAKLLLLLLIASFAVWGVGDMLRSSGRSAAVAKVGDAAISREEYARALRRSSESMREALGDRYSPDILKQMHLPQQVLQKLIAQSLLRQESAALGFIPSDADIVRRLRGNPAFQDASGHFDKSIFEAGLHNANVSEKAYIQELRGEIGAGLLVDTLLSAVPVADAEAQALFGAREEQRRIRLLTLTPSLIADVPTPDATQIESYYKEHAQAFTAPETRQIRYVTLSPPNVPATASNTPGALEAMYKERIEEFKKPERRSVRQLLYADEKAAQKAEALLKAGQSVTQVAQATQILNKGSLELGTVARDGLPAGAADAVFALPAGGFTAPVKSPFGWHIFAVTAIDAPGVASFEEVRPQLEKELGARGNDEALSQLAAKLEDALGGGATLDEAARELGLNVKTVGPITQTGDTPSGAKADIPSLDKFLETAFKTEEKSDSALMPVKGGGYYLLHVESVTPAHPQALTDIRPQIIAAWQKDERQRRLEAMGKALAQKLADPKTQIPEVSRLTSQVMTIKHIGDAQHPLPQALIADIFSRHPGESTQSYPDGQGNRLIARLDAILPAVYNEKDAAMSAELAEIHSELQKNAADEILEQYTDYLAKKYPVSIHDNALPADSD